MEKNILEELVQSLSDEQLETIGNALIEFAQMKKSKDYPDRVFTDWGTKTPIGVTRSIFGILIEKTK